MTTNKGSLALGATPDGAELRRRNVPRDSNGSIVPSQNEVDDKKSQKVSTGSFLPNIPSLISPCAAQISDLNIVHTRRIRIPHCTSHLHNTRILYTNVQDRTVGYRHLG